MLQTYHYYPSMLMTEHYMDNVEGDRCQAHPDRNQQGSHIGEEHQPHCYDELVNTSPYSLRDDNRKGWSDTIPTGHGVGRYDHGSHKERKENRHYDYKSNMTLG